VIDFQRIPHQQLSESHTVAFKQCKHSAKIGFKLLYGCRAAVTARLGPIFILFKVAGCSNGGSRPEKIPRERCSKPAGASAKFVEHGVAQEEAFNFN